MIEKIDLFQKALHHKKVAHLEGHDTKGDGFYVTKELFNDINEKLNEVIDYVNVMIGAVPQKPSEQATVRAQTRTEAERDVLSRFVNSGETCLTISARNVLSASENILGYDVVVVKQVDAETMDLHKVADRAIEIAKKRTIVGVHASISGLWKIYLARVPYHWEQYELNSDKEMEYYIIDKLEGQEILA